jgi:hypothetical protein
VTVEWGGPIAAGISLFTDDGMYVAHRPPLLRMPKPNLNLRWLADGYLMAVSVT